jgi:DNA replication protein DnaC
MSASNNTQPVSTPSDDVEPYLPDLKRAFLAQHSAPLAPHAAPHAWSHVAYLARRLEGEANVRRDRTTQRRIRLARFPGIKTLEPCRWDWPPRLNRLQVPHHFRLAFLQEKAHRISLGGVGLGKPPLATARGYPAGLQGYSVLFASALDVLKTLAAAKQAGRLKAELQQDTNPALLLRDELGDLPMDKPGADLLFHVLSRRYEPGAIGITSNRAFQEWPKSCNHDSTLTAAILDRLLHHAETVLIEGKSGRMKDQLAS